VRAQRSGRECRPAIDDVEGSCAGVVLVGANEQVVVAVPVDVSRLEGASREVRGVFASQLDVRGGHRSRGGEGSQEDGDGTRIGIDIVILMGADDDVGIAVTVHVREGDHGACRIISGHAQERDEARGASAGDRADPEIDRAGIFCRCVIVGSADEDVILAVPIVITGAVHGGAEPASRTARQLGVCDGVQRVGAGRDGARDDPDGTGFASVVGVVGATDEDVGVVAVSVEIARTSDRHSRVGTRRSFEGDVGRVRVERSGDGAEEDVDGVCL